MDEAKKFYIPFTVTMYDHLMDYYQRRQEWILLYDLTLHMREHKFPIPQLQMKGIIQHFASKYDAEPTYNLYRYGIDYNYQLPSGTHLDVLACMVYCGEVG